MRYLLDTSVWLWSVFEPERMSPEAREIFADGGEELFLSAATSWEIAVKVAAGKLHLPEPPVSYVPSRMASQGLLPLIVSHQHALAVSVLPLHHRDPFDRILIAQARHEGMVLITSDKIFQRYPVKLLWAA